MKTKIRYRHYRLPVGLFDESTGKPDRTLLEGWPFPSANGGKTECTISFYDDNDNLLGKVTGYAYCSLSDTYVKKIGREIAFTRAMKLFQYA